MSVVVGHGDFRYELQQEWEQLPKGWTHPDVPSVAINSKDHVILFTRSAHPIIVYDKEGRIITSWGEGIFTNPHGVTVGPDDSLYCVDNSDHTVRRFSTEGILLQTLGTPGRASDTGFVDDYRAIPASGPPFNGPTNLAIASSGDLYVTDGYGNARVHCYSSDGDLRFSWGQPGNGEGEFWIPHAIAISPDDRVFVADRENNRIQVFDLTGRFLEEWTDLIRPTNLAIDGNQRVYITEVGLYLGRYPWLPPDTPTSPPSRCSIFDLKGRLLERWGSRESCAPGQFYAPHGVAVDSEGSLYVSEACWSGGGKDGDVPADCHTIQKFTHS